MTTKVTQKVKTSRQKPEKASQNPKKGEVRNPKGRGAQKVKLDVSFEELAGLACGEIANKE